MVKKKKTRFEIFEAIVWKWYMIIMGLTLLIGTALTLWTIR